MRTERKTFRTEEISTDNTVGGTELSRSRQFFALRSVQGRKAARGARANETIQDTHTMQFPFERFQTTETPFYYYDLGLLRETLDTIKACTAAHPDFHVHYAVKANANPRLLKLISSYGLGADCVSGGEIEASLAGGFKGSDIVFAGVGKSDREIKLALKAGIHSFNVESLPELEVIDALAAEAGVRARVAFRVNPNVDAHTHEKITTGLNENKFGIALEDVLPAVKLAAGMPNVDFVGLHFHIGSQILDLSVYESLCEVVNQLNADLSAAGFAPKSINVGGGLGIDYDAPDARPVPDFESYFSLFARCLRLSEGQELHFELGRSVVGQCGTLVARTLYVKHGHAKSFVIVDAGFTDLVRPAMYGSHHFTQNISASPESESAVYDVVGPICESSDVFSKGEKLPVTHRGDLIAFRSAGAYGEAMASTYNCRRLPASVYSED